MVGCVPGLWHGRRQFSGDHRVLIIGCVDSRVC